MQENKLMLREIRSSLCEDFESLREVARSMGREEALEAKLSLAVDYLRPIAEIITKRNAEPKTEVNKTEIENQCSHRLPRTLKLVTAPGQFGYLTDELFAEALRVVGFRVAHPGGKKAGATCIDAPKAQWEKALITLNTEEMQRAHALNAGELRYIDAKVVKAALDALKP